MKTETYQAFAILITAVVSLALLSFLYNTLCVWLIKKTSAIFLFLINGAVKQIVPGINDINMPANTSSALAISIWLFSMICLSSFLSSIIFLVDKKYALSFDFSIIYLFSYFILRVCNRYVDKNDTQPSLTEDNFFDSVFKLFKKPF